MDQRTTVTTTQNFLLFGCRSEQYSINLSENLLSPDNTYTVRYTYPNNSTKGVIAEFVRKNQLLVKNPPDFDHPCTVHVEVCANGSKQGLAKFSLDLVSPVEYLFRKYSQDDNEMSSSDKMISALLAMSLSYYYVMEEQMKMEKKADKILSTFLTCRGNTAPPKHITSVQSATYDDNIKEFSKRHQLQCTLQCLLDPLSTYDMPSKEHYAPLINARNTDDSCHYEVPNSGQTTETTAGGYDIPNNGGLTFLARRTVAVQPPQPYATRKMEQTKSLGSITDEDSDYTYVDRDVARSKSPSMTQPQAKPFDSIIDEDFDHTYVVPDIFQSKSPSMTQPRARPPRPPPPRRAESPNKPPVMQRTVAPSSPLEKKSIPLGQRYSVPVALPPTPKQRATNQWYKDKH